MGLLHLQILKSINKHGYKLQWAWRGHSALGQTEPLISCVTLAQSLHLSELPALHLQSITDTSRVMWLPRDQVYKTALNRGVPGTALLPWTLIRAARSDPASLKAKAVLSLYPESQHRQQHKPEDIGLHSVCSEEVVTGTEQGLGIKWPGSFSSGSTRAGVGDGCLATVLIHLWDHPPSH